MKDINVHLSQNSEDEVMVYDDCGRYIPVHYEYLEELISRLQEFQGYFAVMNADQRRRVSHLDISPDTQGK